MPRTTLTTQSAKGPYPLEPVAADSLDLTFTAADITNQNQFSASGRDLVAIRNAHLTTAFTFTLNTAPDTHGRKADITSYALQAGEVVLFFFTEVDGWRQSDGFIYLDANSVSIQYAVVRLP